ncbi:MAG: NAD(P)/FAD-dependent oxidoreductase [Aldersonia sp.]|nr:NAD(P)/FAD-dependent oxidoreductase [Aldersonia sp.]
MSSANDNQSPQHVDVVVIGAGISGICAGYRLQERRRKTSYVILEKRDDIGGTWDLFRFPGVRADSDIQTMEFPFRPWLGAEVLAPGPAIRSYMHETASVYGIDRNIRFGHRVTGIEWSSQQARWTVSAETARGTVRFTCRFIMSCSGYYDGDGSFQPHFPGMDRFAGPIVHPQHWPEDLDYAGKRVVVIGSGATAMTLVPAMAKTAHVTMLQRSPGYVLSMPGEDVIRKALLRVLPERFVHRLVRWKNVLIQMFFWYASRISPRFVKAVIRRQTQSLLETDELIDPHFTPRYNPWDQRMCIVPDGDVHVAIREGRVSVVTDTIATFTEKGIRTTSGSELTADIIVTATGFDMRILPGVEVTVDGERIDPADTVFYKGVMLSGIPNLTHSMGYPNASWTLKADLACRYAVRLIDYMDEQGYSECRPARVPAHEETTPAWNLRSNYIARARFPKQGAKRPWRVFHNYFADAVALRWRRVEDDALEFTKKPVDRLAAAS